MDAANPKVCELIDLISYRRDRYGLIAGIFSHESTEETLTQIINQAYDFNQEFDESLELTLNRGLRALACEDLSAFATKTRTEYARLFLGPREVVAPLHESAYLSGTSRMFTAETLAVRECYERYGYVMKAKNREPEDSISLELEFLRNLCNRCITLLENGINCQDASEEVRRLLEAQRAFREQHLARWAQEFAERVMNNDRSGYYVVWAAYLSGVLYEDERILNECEQLLDAIESPQVA
jgi:TorA maturation chaperone TorD